MHSQTQGEQQDVGSAESRRIKGRLQAVLSKDSSMPKALRTQFYRSLSRLWSLEEWKRLESDINTELEYHAKVQAVKATVRQAKKHYDRSKRYPVGYNPDIDIVAEASRRPGEVFHRSTQRAAEAGPILYRLNELTDGDDPVVIPEGEGKVDALVALGHTATACPFGAGAWLPHYAEYLRGRECVIWPDKDAAGMKFAETVARSLHGIAASVRIVTPPDFLPEGGDVVDIVKAAGR